MHTREQANTHSKLPMGRSISYVVGQPAAAVAADGMYMLGYPYA